MSTHSRYYLRWAAVLLVVFVLVVGLVGRAEAVVIDHNGVIAAGITVDDDVVLTATQVTMDGAINGTLIAAGQTILINGTIHGDALVIGQNITIGEKAVIDGNLFAGGALIGVSGKIGGTIFGGGAALALNDTASVGRNLFFGGYDLETKAGVKIGRDLVAADYQTNLAGQVRNVTLAAAAIDISGLISGDATLRVATSQTGGVDSMRYWQFGQPGMPAAAQPGLRIAESAKIGGKLTYTSAADQSSTIQTAPNGGTVYQTPVPNQTERQPAQRTFFNPPFFDASGFWLWAMLRNLVTIIMLGILALWLAPAIFMGSLAQLQQRLLAAMGVGLLSLVAVLFMIPVIGIGLILLGLFFAVLTLVDLAGIFAGLGFLVFCLAGAIYFILFAWAGKLLVSYYIGSWILNKLAPQATVQRFWVLVLGALIFVLLAAIPFAGFLLTFLVDLAGAGALWYVWHLRKV